MAAPLVLLLPWHAQVKSRVTKEEGSMDSRMRKFKDNNVPWDTNALTDIKKGSLMLVGPQLGDADLPHGLSGAVGCLREASICSEGERRGALMGPNDEQQRH